MNTMYAIYTPKGYLMKSTLSATRRGAKRKVLTIAQQKYNALISSFFKDWEKIGYTCEVVTVQKK